MTSSDDFHLISWRNFFGLAAILCAVCVPILVRWKWSRELHDEDPIPQQEIRLHMVDSARPSLQLPNTFHVLTQREIGAANGLGLVGLWSEDPFADRPCEVTRVPLVRPTPSYEDSDSDDEPKHLAPAISGSAVEVVGEWS